MEFLEVFFEELTFFDAFIVSKQGEDSWLELESKKKLLRQITSSIGGLQVKTMQDSSNVVCAKAQL